ncbi:hypothetical protein [Mycobacteroides abscessus]|uniref:hypothetical protein n=1 Tax=Mycobacteroides abscessus TaxID=36809 RepID=UPI0010C9AC49|nr:hypothetical protein [Mycobacteroides abscessus]TKV35346.1 hypothetical protein CFA71_24060 [Mycobacteroides abscessus subsp. bolletii]
MADIVIRNVTNAEAIRIAQALGDREHEVIEIAWTPAEAAAVLGVLAERQRALIRGVVDWRGVQVVEASRADSLRGVTGPITKAVRRLTAAGELREGLPPILATVYDPDAKANQRVRAFRMEGPTLAAFTAAIAASEER